MIKSSSLNQRRELNNKNNPKMD